MSGARVSDLYPTDEREEEPMVPQERPASPNGTGLTNPDDPRHPSYLRDLARLMARQRDLMASADAKRQAKRRELCTIQRLLDELAADIRVEVADEQNEAGKPRYSNAESRAAAVNQQLRADSKACAWQASIDSIEVEIAELEQQFEMARRERQDAAAVLSFAGQWLGYWTTNTREGDHAR